MYSTWEERPFEFTSNYMRFLLCCLQDFILFIKYNILYPFSFIFSATDQIGFAKNCLAAESLVHGF